MNLEYFISKRLISAKENKNVFSRPIIRITISAISLSVAVMIISISVLFGFKQEITNKVIVFGSHIQIKSIQKSESNSETPLQITDELEESILKHKEVIEINNIIYDFGLVKTSDNFLGINLKGVNIDLYNWSNLKDNIINGETLNSDTSILISSVISKKLKLEVGEKIRVYFPSIKDERPKVRPFYICGIYKTSMSEFDDVLTFVSIEKLRKVKRWEEDQVGLLELSINNLSNLSSITNKLSFSINDYYNKEVKNIKELYPQIFDWLELQDVNVVVIMILMLLVAAINIISSILILILERTKLIGILKSLGSSNWNIRKIFIYISMYLSFKGLIWGNLIAFVLIFMQYQFNIITLNETIYYIDTIPISFDLLSIMILNIGTLILCFLVMIFPSMIITKIPAIKAIRFE